MTVLGTCGLAETPDGLVGRACPWTCLTIQMIQEDLQVVLPGCIVNHQPYASIHGILHLRWRKRECSVPINDEVRAARGEGSCGLLGFQDAIRAAESQAEFHIRRKNHVDLQGQFQERWELLLAMADDVHAEGIRTAIYVHTLSNRQRLRAAFSHDYPMQISEVSRLLNTEREHGVMFSPDDPPCPVRKAAYLVLHPSTHLDEHYARLLLDWLDNKVALVLLIQVANEVDGTPRVFHVPEQDILSDEAVLFIKLLNIEKQGPARNHSNHFDRIGGENPIGFIEDLRGMYNAMPDTDMPYRFRESKAVCESAAISELMAINELAAVGETAAIVELATVGALAVIL